MRLEIKVVYTYIFCIFYISRNGDLFLYTQYTKWPPESRMGIDRNELKPIMHFKYNGSLVDVFVLLPTTWHSCKRPCSQKLQFNILP